VKKTYFIIQSILFLFLLNCSSLPGVKSKETINPNDGVCVLGFKLVTGSKVEKMSMDIVGNNETIQMEIETGEDNIFFTTLGAGTYQIENIKASITRGGSAKDSPDYISGNKLFFIVKGGVINYLGFVLIRETASELNANLVFKGRTSRLYISLETSFSERLWDIFKNKYKILAEKYPLERNFLSFKRRIILSEEIFKRVSGLFRGQSSVDYKMLPLRVKEILLKENRNFDIVGLSEIIERGKENSLIKYIFSDNNSMPQWLGRLYKIVEITDLSESEVIKRLNKKYSRTGEKRWQSNFEIITIKVENNKTHIFYTAKKFL